MGVWDEIFYELFEPSQIRLEGTMSKKLILLGLSVATLLSGMTAMACDFNRSMQHIG